MNWQNNFKIFYIPSTLRSIQDIKDNHSKCHTCRCHRALHTQKKCPSADKPAPHIPHFVSQSPCCRPVTFAVIHRCMCSSVSSLSLFPKAAAALLQILQIPRPCWGRTGGPRRDPRTKTGPQLLSIWTSDPAKHHNTISALICEAFSCS